MSANEWTWYHVITNAPMRVVRVGCSNGGFKCIEVITRRGTGDDLWTTERLVLTDAEVHFLAQ
jgi:hypothetical protein